MPEVRDELSGPNTDLSLTLVISASDIQINDQNVFLNRGRFLLEVGLWSNHDKLLIYS